MRINKNYNISYHCTSFDEVCRVLTHFSNRGYTFNGEKQKRYSIGRESNDGYINTIIHICDEEMDMGYDYYYVDNPQKLEMISKGMNIVNSNVLFRPEKLRRIVEQNPEKL
jgi:hypothetical protein